MSRVPDCAVLSRRTDRVVLTPMGTGHSVMAASTGPGTTTAAGFGFSGKPLIKYSVTVGHCSGETGRSIFCIIWTIIRQPSGVYPDAKPIDGNAGAITTIAQKCSSWSGIAHTSPTWARRPSSAAKAEIDNPAVISENSNCRDHSVPLCRTFLKSRRILVWQGSRLESVGQDQLQD